jgi:FkbM family methyltransferase
MKPYYFLRKISRKMGEFRGLRRISEKIREKHSSVAHTEVIDDFDGDIKFACDLNSHIGSRIFWNGFYSRSQLTLLNRILDAEMVFVDIGANEGEHTLFAAKRVRGGQVYSFEPFESVRCKLEKNIALNEFNNVKVIAQGLSDKPGNATLYSSQVAEAAGSLNSGLPSLHWRPGLEGPTSDVAVTTLDSFIERENLSRIDFIKIDVEGSERAVLNGARKTIEKYGPILLLEVCKDTCEAAGYSRSDLLSLVVQMGYRVENILEDGSTSFLGEDFENAARDVICYPRRRLS